MLSSFSFHHLTVSSSIVDVTLCRGQGVNSEFLLIKNVLFVKNWFQISSQLNAISVSIMLQCVFKLMSFSFINYPKYDRSLVVSARTGALEIRVGVVVGGRGSGYGAVLMVRTPR